MIQLPLILIGIGVLMAFTPRWTRPDLYFAVTVETDFAFTPAARRILHQYWLELALHTLIALALASLIGAGRGLAVAAGVGYQMFGLTWAIARANRATRQFSASPSPLREAILTPGPKSMPISWLAALGPMVFVALAGLYSWLWWERLPERLPVHWGMQGPDRWVDRTPLNVAGFLALLLAFCIVFLVVTYGLLRWSRTISPTGERGQVELRFRRSVVWLLLVLPYLVVIPGVLLAFWPGEMAAWPWPALTVSVAAAALIALIRMGQGGSRAAAVTEFQPPIGDRTPDTAWKWGVFYFNPNDTAIFVEKRFGLGHTLNFGNRWSWAILAILLLPVAVALALR